MKEHKEIPLTQNKFALVDIKDFDYLNQFKWCTHKQRNTYYAVRSIKKNGKKALLLMHREILKPPKGMCTDHINGDGLDNRRGNLRICSNSQNLMNRGKQKNNASGFKGVWWQKIERKWQAQIQVNKKVISLGYYPTKECAAIAYNEAATKYHGEFARLNQVERLVSFVLGG